MLESMWNAIAVVRPPNKLLKLVLEDQSQARAAGMKKREFVAGR